MWLSPKLKGPGSPTGQRSLHHRGDTLETLVLLNPSDKSLCDEVGKGRLLGGSGLLGPAPSPGPNLQGPLTSSA